MAKIALFPSVLGVRRGIECSVEFLTDHGHEVTVVDQYKGRTFDNYDEALAFSDELGYPAQMVQALQAVRNLPEGFFVMGFSNGAGMAEHVALHRQVAGAILVAGALDLTYLGAEEWVAGVPVTLHQTVDDPWFEEGANDEFMKVAARAGAVAEYVLYPGKGHLFTDDELPDEYDEETTRQFWERVLAFIERHDKNGG